MENKTEKMIQLCMRCFKNLALKDGSDEGKYYCKECIDIRKIIEDKEIEEKIREQERMVGDDE